MPKGLIITEKHNIAPVFNENSKILILGSFPSVKSRQQQFFYGHPQNRFWKMLAAVFGEKVPSDIPEKTALLLNHGIALWDVIGSCDIKGSSDGSIKNAAPNDLGQILGRADIKRIITNGQTAHRLYLKLIKNDVGIDDICMPSTSPANAACSLEQLILLWSGALLF